MGFVILMAYRWFPSITLVLVDYEDFSVYFHLKLENFSLSQLIIPHFTYVDAVFLNAANMSRLQSAFNACTRLYLNCESTTRFCQFWDAASQFPIRIVFAYFISICICIMFFYYLHFSAHRAFLFLFEILTLIQNFIMK